MKLDQIDWQYVKEPATEAQIQFVEERLGVKFPADYLKVAKVYHGSHISNAVLDYMDENGDVVTIGVNLLLSFDPNKYPSNLILTNARIANLPQGLVVFGQDAGGGCFCFDYRTNQDNPSIILWYYNSGNLEWFCPLADSFTGFIDALRVE